MPRALILALVAQLALLGCVNRVRENGWLAVRTKRFEIFTTLRAEDAKALATELERFHALVYAITSAPRVESPIPTRIYAFARRTEYAQFAPENAVGFIQPGLRENTIVLLDHSSNLGASEIILHEYTHFVLRNGKNRPYPLWYDEGFAELMSTVARRGDLLVVGAIPKERIPALESGVWVPTAKIVAARGYDDLAPKERFMLYPQSWALTHYLTLDREPGSTPMPVALAKYLELLEAGTDSEAAYRAAFGEFPARTGKRILELLDHGKMNVIGVPLARLDYDRTEPTVRNVPPVEVWIRIGQLHSLRRNGESAAKAYETAIGYDPKQSRAHAGMGDALLIQKRYADAERYYRRATELEPTDPLNTLDLGEFHHARAQRQATSVEAMRADLEQARVHFEKVLEARPTMPEAQAMMGATHLMPGEDPMQAIVWLQKSFASLPTSSDLIRMLAEAHLAAGDSHTARRYLTRMLSVRGEERRDVDIEKAMDEIEKDRLEVAKRVGFESE